MSQNIVALLCVFGAAGQEFSQFEALTSVEAGRTHQFADVNGDKKADFCRIIQSYGTQYASCALAGEDGFTNIEFSAGNKTHPLPVGDWFAIFSDVNGDGRADFCRRVRNQVPSCLLAGEDRFTSVEYTLPPEYSSDWGNGKADLGYGPGRMFTDVNQDGRSDFCRIIGDFNPVNPARPECLLSGVHNFTTELLFPTFPENVGIYETTKWADANNDGRPDICRLIGTGSHGDPVRPSCALLGENQFTKTEFQGSKDAPLNVGDKKFAFFADVSGDGRADFCRSIGPSTWSAGVISCALASESGFSSQEYALPNGLSTIIMGSSGMFADVNADGKMDFCRMIGDEHVESSLRPACILAGPTSFCLDSIACSKRPTSIEPKKSVWDMIVDYVDSWIA